MRLPKFFAACDDCWDNNPEAACRYPEAIAWSHKAQKWLCDDCWSEVDQEYDEARGEYIDDEPMAFAKDAMLGTEEQMQRLIAAATRKRMGVKT
jgi:hypothetical protein